MLASLWIYAKIKVDNVQSKCTHSGWTVEEKCPHATEIANTMMIIYMENWRCGPFLFGIFIVGMLFFVCQFHLIHCSSATHNENWENWGSSLWSDLLFMIAFYWCFSGYIFFLDCSFETKTSHTNREDFRCLFGAQFFMQGKLNACG